MASPLFADVALCLALGAYGELLVRLRLAEPAKPWWFGYARDGANLAASLMLWGTYLMLGYPAATALLAGLLTALATYLLDWTIARALKVPHPRLVLAVPLGLWVALVIFVPARVATWFELLTRVGRPS